MIDSDLHQQEFPPSPPVVLDGTTVRIYNEVVCLPVLRVSFGSNGSTFQIHAEKMGEHVFFGGKWRSVNHNVDFVHA